MKKKYFLSRVGISLLLFLLSSALFGQNVGDFQTRPTGVVWPQTWNAPVWQIYTSGGWQDTTSFPGETPGNYTVTVLSGDEVSTTGLTAVTIGNLYVKGTLNITQNFTINTFGSGPVPYLYIEKGRVNISKNVDLKLPTGSNIYLNIDNVTQGIHEDGGCTGSTRIYIGTTIYTACKGTSEVSFDEVNATAADASISSTASPSKVCLGAEVSLTGDKSGAAVVSNIKWKLISTPSGTVNITLGTSATVPYTYVATSSILNMAGDYIFEFSFTVGASLTKYKTVNVRVNGPTFTTTPAATTTYCQNNTATALSVVASGAGTLTYQWYSNTANTTTGGTLISGANSSSYTPSTSSTGTIYYYVVVTATCGIAKSNTAQVIVNPSTATITTQPVPAATYCQNTATSPLTVSGSGVTSYQWYSSATSTGPGTPISGATSSAYMPPANITGTVYYYVILQGSCGAATSNRAAITVNEQATAVVVANQAGPICSGLGAVFNLTGTSGSTVTYNINGGSNQTVVLDGGAGTVTVPSVTADQTLNMVSVSNGGCNSPLSSSATVTVGQTTVYNSGWSIPPTASNNLSAEIRSAYSSTGDLNICSLLVTNNAPVTINEGHVLKVQDGITVTTGSLTIASNANLIQVNDAAINSGTITVLRDAYMKRQDYNYWGSPVAGQNVKAFSPNTLTNRFYVYNEADDKFTAADTAGNFVPGTGYAIRAPNNFPADNLTYQTFNGIFKGAPNNGHLSTPLSFTDAAHGNNLVGNPYPSNINFYELYSSNNTLIYNTAYFWTNVNPNPAMQGAGYPGAGYINNYAVLNGTGGLPATFTAGTDARVPNEYIKVGQGFIVKAKTSGDLQYSNSFRNANSSSIFFNRNGEAHTVSEKDRFWLHLKTPLGVITTALIGYVEHASNGYEKDYDSELFGLGSDAVFSQLGDKKLGIQGRTAPFDPSDVVMLGTNHYATGNYSLSMALAEGIFANGQAVYLKDLQTGTLTNLSEQHYSFTAEKGLTEGRFEIIYQPETVLAAGGSTKDQVTVYRSGSEFVVKSFGMKVSHLEVYDTSGKLMMRLHPDQTEIRIDAESWVNGMYVLKMERGGTLTTKKVMK